MPRPTPILDQAALWRLLLHVCADLFTLGRLSESGLRHQLGRLGYTPQAIAAEVEFLRGRMAG